MINVGGPRYGSVGSALRLLHLYSAADLKQYPHVRNAQIPYYASSHAASIAQPSMAYNSSGGYVASNTFQDLSQASLPIFNTEQVQLKFAISSEFVAAQVANNVLILALSTGRILRIDLDNPEDIDGLACH